MDLSTFVENVRRDLTAAVEAAGPEGRTAAEHMLRALEPALRLSALELLSEAADEMTAALPGGAVEVRLRGRDAEMVALAPRPIGATAPEVHLDDETEEREDDPVARVTLRIPESVKARAEEQAARNGLSLNSWIVTVLRAAMPRRAVNVDVDLTSIPLESMRSTGLPAGRRAVGTR